MTKPNPDKLDIPQPFKMAPNAWEVGYYDGYNGYLDQRFWSNDSELLRADYRRGWSEAKHYRIFEILVNGKSPPRHKGP